MRFDVNSRTSDIVCVFVLPLDASSTDPIDLESVKLGNDAVIAETIEWIVVGNWRTGDAKVISIGRVSMP